MVLRVPDNDINWHLNAVNVIDVSQTFELVLFTV